MLDLGIPGKRTAAEHVQWRIETLRMVNWGGFQGPSTVRFSPGSTLVSGASGTGKSTLLDAYIALMMPSSTPFNGASNDAGEGRARSSEQRNLLTYLRGKMDAKSEAGTGEKRDQVLRGSDGGPVWGALGATFVNDAGRRFTALRVYYAKAGARLGGDVVTTFASFDGSFDLARLDDFAAARFDKRQLKAGFPGLQTYGSWSEFETMLHTRLGIGDGGDGGRQAMRLLARVQAGMQINKVDDLYKKMVLERPATYEAADRALTHFANLEDSYAKMADEAAKVRTLRRLPELQRELAEAEAKAELIRRFGAETEGPSPFLLWRARTERGLLDAALVENRAARADTLAALEQARKEEAEFAQLLDRIAEGKRASGGDAIDARRREIVELGKRRDSTYQAGITFRRRTEAIGLDVPETADQFAAAQRQAGEFLQGFPAREEQLRTEEETVRDTLAPLTTRRGELLKEKGSLADRTSSVPLRLHLARVRMAQAAGLDPTEDLPFVAELIDVLPGEGRWRTAVENTLGGVARTVLVDRRLRNQLSAAIDGVTITPRIRFQAVTLRDHQEWSGDPAYVSGKLSFKDSPFSAWVRERVTRDGVDHLCVEDTRSLNGPGARVTPAGQTRDGDRGAHGESGDGPVIGFSNKLRLQDIEAQLTELDPRMAAVRQQIADVGRRLNDLRARKTAHEFVRDTLWDDIDHLGIGRRIAELEAEVVRLREANQVLDALQREEERVRPLHDEAVKNRVLADSELKTLDAAAESLVEAQEGVQRTIDAIEGPQTALVTPEQQEYLDALFADHWDATNLETFPASMQGLRRRLGEEAASAQRAAKSATGALEGMFEAYQRQWPDNNLGTTAVAAPDYRELLDRIEAAGLHASRAAFKREFTAWSSDDLLTLNDAFDTALDDIQDRLHPINRILETLPFGGKGVLQIHLRRQASQEVADFRANLRRLSSGLALELTDDQVEARFTALRDFMARIGVPEGHTKSSTSLRDRYLDVRQHVVVTAVVLDENRREVASYDYIGDKSGGELQELVAFIVGSALRYQLGDESRSRPRFAPVLLDEGFVKADSDFAGRAVTAWQNLGFQLIIGAPLDKVTALEPHMDLILSVTKSAKGYSFVEEISAVSHGAGEGE